MKDPLRERRFRWWGNVFVLPDGRKVNPLLVLVPVFLIVGFSVNYIYQQGHLPPSAPLIDSKILEAGLEIAPVVTSPQEQIPTATLPQDQDNVPPVAEVPPATTTTPSAEGISLVYSIRVGKGRQMEFVYRSLKKLRRDDQDAFFQKVGDQYWVLVGRFAKIQEAQDKLDVMIDSGRYAGEVVTLSEADPVQRSSN